MRTQVNGLIGAFRQLREVVGQLDATQYSRRSANGDGSIGGHVRHCLDHVQALLAGISSGVVDYDRRERGTLVEFDPVAAARRMSDLEGPLVNLAGLSGREVLTVAVLSGPERPSTMTQSSLGREIAFVQSHTIHHCAIIAMLARAAGATVPVHFGYAPATITHLQRTA